MLQSSWLQSDCYTVVKAIRAGHKRGEISSSPMHFPKQCLELTTCRWSLVQPKVLGRRELWRAPGKPSSVQLINVSGSDRSKSSKNFRIYKFCANAASITYHPESQNIYILVWSCFLSPLLMSKEVYSCIIRGWCHYNIVEKKIMSLKLLKIYICSERSY